MYTLFDPDATYSFIFTNFARLDMLPEPLEYEMHVDITTGDS